MSAAGGDPAAARRRAPELRRALCGWYGRHRRDLPWRRTRDPYAVWISEAMLQQTRVETVIPYWERFLERLPTVAHLARAGEAELLELWSGLGYYRRARALGRAAAVIEAEHGGAFPRELAAALALPGVGPYTAGAVLSIAYDEPCAVVDGNVLRVLARLFALEAPVDSAELRRRAWTLAEELVPRGARGDEGPGAWNQALMELGATVCVPREPRCLACPLHAACEGRRRGLETRLPTPGRKRAPVEVELDVVVVAERGRVLLEQRPAGGRMAGLWELPTREPGAAGGRDGRLFPARFRAPAAGCSLHAGELVGEVRHGITHHRIRARVHGGRLARAAGSRARVAPPFAWCTPEQLASRALTGMTRKVLRAGLVPRFRIAAPGVER